jgi:hypothetical protein
VFGGTYGLYFVREPVRIVTFGDRSADSVVVQNERIVAVGVSAGGRALVRRNWFPRWRARVNGRDAAVARTEDGYMLVDVPAGPVRLELDYVLDPFDIAARFLMGGGVLLVIGLCRPGAGRPLTDRARHLGERSDSRVDVAACAADA